MTKEPPEQPRLQVIASDPHRLERLIYKTSASGEDAREAEGMCNSLLRSTLLCNTQRGRGTVRIGTPKN